MKVFALLALFSATTASAATTCRLPADQGVGSLYGKWTRLPITLVLDREMYTTHGGREARAVERAVATWNRWGRANGFTAFVIAQNNRGMEIPHLKDCVQSTYTESLRGVVGIWKITGQGFRSNERASCGMNSDGTPGKILPFGVQGQTDWAISNGKISGASVLLNFTDYNAPRKPSLDVESMVLHELGHVLGLLHSCNVSHSGVMDSTTAPACFTNGEATAPKDYLEAVMFPFLEVGQSRRVLQSNDIGRASCLY